MRGRGEHQLLLESSSRRIPREGYACLLEGDTRGGLVNGIISPEMPCLLCTLRTVVRREESPQESGRSPKGRWVAWGTRDPEGDPLASRVAGLSDLSSVDSNICPGGQ